MREYRVRIGGNVYTVRVIELSPERFKVVVEGEEVEVEVGQTSGAQVEKGASVHASQRAGESTALKATLPTSTTTAIHAVDGVYTTKTTVVEAPVPGKVLKVLVGPGDIVDKKTVLLTLESMKMELEVYPPRRGVVKEVLVKPGDFVESGSKLVVME
uniref:Acetyl-CoA carboxylase biotin carboxyl carrier protein subunit n=1 Tax=Fervidicoccus fontis TaxID=683846 RepID=A0A7J3ZKQ4_9CREN